MSPKSELSILGGLPPKNRTHFWAIAVDMYTCRLGCAVVAVGATKLQLRFRPQVHTKYRYSYDVYDVVCSGHGSEHPIVSVSKPERMRLGDKRFSKIGVC